MNREAPEILQQLSGYRWWLRKYRGLCLKTGVWTLLVVAVVAFGLYMAGLESFDRWEILFAGGMLLFFAGYGVYQLGLLAVSFFRKPAYCWFGTVEKTLHLRLPNRRTRALIITASVQGKTIDGVCQHKTYHLAQPGQRVVLFSYDGSHIYCVHPEM